MAGQIKLERFLHITGVPLIVHPAMLCGFNLIAIIIGYGL